MLQLHDWILFDETTLPVEQRTRKFNELPDLPKNIAYFVGEIGTADLYVVFQTAKVLHLIDAVKFWFRGQWNLGSLLEMFFCRTFIPEKRHTDLSNKLQNRVQF